MFSPIIVLNMFMKAGQLCPMLLYCMLPCIGLQLLLLKKNRLTLLQERLSKANIICEIEYFFADSEKSLFLSSDQR